MSQSPPSSHSVVYFSLGTNLGDRFYNLRRALLHLSEFVQIEKVSPIYKTPPWGPIADQPSFYNIAAKGYTSLTPDRLLQQIKGIETEIGRILTDKWGPRLIDIDILYFSNRVISDGNLTIPHAQIDKRGFVLVPLADIASEHEDPRTQTKVKSMLANLSVEERLEIELVSHSGPLFPQPFLKRPPTGIEWGKRTYLMGVLNITPDSFSGDGLKSSAADDVVERAVALASRFIEEGADILDVGGESTRPGYEEISARAEIERVVPVIDGIRKRFPEVVISIDTYRSETAQAALRAGADWINDIWGLQFDPEIGTVAAQTGAPVIIMHNGRNRPRQERDDGAGGYYGYYHYDDLIGEIVRELSEAADLALSKGVAPDQIILDPGIGFGKTAPQNIELLRKMDQLRTLGYPILLGSSRKGFIGSYLGKLPASERTEGTAATVSIGISKGADIVRVHDMKAISRIARMTDLLVR
ncbi:MAG: dihydropteroate synthase [Chloroflexota bacterium]